MVQILNRSYFVSDRLVKETFKDKDKFYVRLTTEEVQEISEKNYHNLGGK